MVIASIDLMNQKAVQLRQGKNMVLQRDDPLSLARAFDVYGEIAVIDLDAAKGNGDNKTLVDRIVHIGTCRVGGGIRTVERAEHLITAGAKSIIIGSQAYTDTGINESFLVDMNRAIGRRRTIIAVDAVNREIVTHGWTHCTGMDAVEMLPQLEPYCDEFLCTCVEREGLMQGTDIPLAKKLAAYTGNRITLAGGVTTLEEIAVCAELGMDVQLGMALYDGTIDLGKAFIAALNWKTDLLPTIAQDSSGQVLMLAYSSRESLARIFETRTMWYYSRSRKKLWHKGATSGNVQHVIKVRADCDQDAILATVRQEGVACHTGWYSCFGDKAVPNKGGEHHEV